MSHTDEKKTRVSSSPDIATMQKEMETRRQHMLKILEESEAKFKSILRASAPLPPVSTPSAGKHRR